MPVHGFAVCEIPQFEDIMPADDAPAPSDPASSSSAAADSGKPADASRQTQFLNVITRDEATERFHRWLRLEPLEAEAVSLFEAAGRVLASDVVAAVDVSGFDRSNVDGFAVQAGDTAEAMEESPRELQLNREELSPGIEPREEVRPGTATAIATGAMLPRGADAVVMIEDTDRVAGETRAIEVTRAVAPGDNLTFAGTDISLGETVLRQGQLLTSREIGVLAAIGQDSVPAVRRPRVAIISTGNEIVPPGGPRPAGRVYDSNLPILAASVSELGGEPVPLGVVDDDEPRLREMLRHGLECDVVVMSGGTSKGAGDLSSRVVSELTEPGVVAHGVALKPGKPVCLAVTAGKPVVLLPGFPTSAVFTFFEFVAPVIRALAGHREAERETVRARVPLRLNSSRGRTEYLMVGLVQTDDGLAAYPLGKGSGSVTTWSTADGFVTIDQHTEMVEAGSQVSVQLISRQLTVPDLVVIGSHCTGLDLLLSELNRRGVSSRVIHVGSTGGLAAARRGECDLAGIHLLDVETGVYNEPLLDDSLELIPGYRREQCLLFRTGDSRFEGRTLEEALAAALADPACRMVCRNAGSGTRIVIDQLLGGRRPPGYAVQPKSHNAVAAAVRQGRADWGIAITPVARASGLGTIRVRDEHYDFVLPRQRAGRPGVQAFRQLLAEPAIRQRLRELGFTAD